MKHFLSAIYRTDVALHVVAGSVLAFMIVVTLLDVIMRNVGHPIVGSVEIISFCGSVVIGFAMPYSSWMKTHVYVDFLVDKLKPRNRMIIDAFTRLMGIILFSFVGYNFILFGMGLKSSGELSASFKLPYYPIAWGLAFSCFLLTFTLFSDFVRTIASKGDSNE
ncbi:MAG TPA: TRAP transporter small permease [Syntrophorhabdales bacterium]|nr:TRAP transporter small permease [Syntrophorhabdales bacterium]